MSQASQSQSKKRKRTQQPTSDVVEQHTGVHFKLVPQEENSAATAGPLFATGGALSLPTGVAYNLYGNKKRRSIVTAETSKTLWESRNHAADLEASDAEEGDVPLRPGYSCEYMMAIYDKRTNTAQLVPAPLHILKSSLKAHKDLPEIGAKVAGVTGERKKQRDLLGTTFGTKKAQRNIRAAERNKVDVTAKDLVRMQAHLQTSLDASLASLPTNEAVKIAAAEAKPIPPVNLQATTPEEAYTYESIADSAEFESIPTYLMKGYDSFDDVISTLPHRTSTFINDRLREILKMKDGYVAEPKKNRTRVQHLVYLSFLFTLKFSRSEMTVDRMAKRMGTYMPPATLEPFLERFSEGARAGTRHRTLFTDAKLLAYITCLALIIDGYSIDITTMAQDLQVEPKAVQEIYKSLGCQIKVPDAAEKARLAGQGLTAREANSRKRAVLEIPLVFPEPRKIKKGGR